LLKGRQDSPVKVAGIAVPRNRVNVLASHVKNGLRE
jgi:hypothetical protein